MSDFVLKGRPFCSTCGKSTDANSAPLASNMRPISEAPRNKNILAYHPNFPDDDGFFITELSDRYGGRLIWYAPNSQSGGVYECDPPLGWWPLPSGITT